jgi:hypothetical protein
MKKLIVTHVNPDIDAITAVWLLKKFHPDLAEASVAFVPAGGTYKNQPVDSQENIIHVDTGLGQFDHHQANNKTCAADLVFNYLKSIKKELNDDQALIRLIKVVRSFDHFEDCLWPNAMADYFNFEIEEILRGLKAAGKIDDFGVIDFGSKCLDGIYTNLKIKIKAEKDLQEGYKFSLQAGKAIGCLSHNDQVLKLGQKMGFVLVVQKDPQTEHVRIKARPDSGIDLTAIKNKLAKLDSEATWFLHASKKILLNGSTKNPKMKPSKLSLKKVIEILQA